MCIQVICFTVDDVISFEITLGFLIKLFSYMTEKLRQSGQKLEYLNPKKTGDQFHLPCSFSKKIFARWGENLFFCNF